MELNSLEEMVWISIGNMIFACLLQETTTAVVSSTTNNSGRLLTLAGLYDIWTPEKLEVSEGMYFFIVIFYQCYIRIYCTHIYE